MSIVSSYFQVSGIRNDNDVRKALQSMYDIFATNGLGQATFEITEPGQAQLIVKHRADIEPSVEAMNAALREAGDYRIMA